LVFIGFRKKQKQKQSLAFGVADTLDNQTTTIGQSKITRLAYLTPLSTQFDFHFPILMMA
jgi:hypothetical protein